MINLNFYSKKNIGIIGFGKTGQIAADAFLKSGANIELFDDKYVFNDNKYAQFFKSYTHFNWENMDALFVSPGIHLLWDHAHDAINMANFYGIKVINDIDLFQMHNYLYDTKKNLICISGTNGKSTTTALIHHIFSCANRNVTIGGNFGVPILALDADKQDYVLELSSYQLESSNILMYDTAVLLNITSDHLVRHGGMTGYAAIKNKIFANFSKKSNAIIGVDDNYCCEIFDFLRYIKHPNVIPISGVTAPDGGIGWESDYLIDKRNNNNDIVCKNVQLLDGIHNRQNIAATYAACVCNSIDKEVFKTALFSFKGLEHRQEIVCDFDGILYVNDSKATNAESVEMALKRFNNIVWILGGRPKENGIENLLPYFNKIKHALLIGETTDLWADFLTKHNVSVTKCYTLETAIHNSLDIIKRNAVSNIGSNKKIDVVLLSPACASFDQFKSFEERGIYFKEMVHKIIISATKNFS